MLQQGAGKRFSSVISKVLLPINGKSIIEHQIELCVNAGFTDIGIVVGETTYVEILGLLRNGAQHGVKITYFFQDHEYLNRPYGLPSAMAEAEHWIKDDFIMLCGDNYIKGADLSAMYLNYHQQWRADGGTIWVGCQEIVGEAACNFAVYDVSRRKFIEKPSPENLKRLSVRTFGESNKYLIYGGPLICNKKVFEKIKTLQPSERGELEITHLINQHDNVMADKYDGVWIDIGSPEQYANAILGESKNGD